MANDDDSISMRKLDDNERTWTPTADFATFSQQMRRQSLAVSISLGILLALLAISVLGVVIWSGGLQASIYRLLGTEASTQAAMLGMAKKICDVDTTYLFNQHCSDQKPVDRQTLCFLMIGSVERYIHLRTREAIFAALAALEPQTGSINYWAVDESTTNEDSHLDKFTNDVVAFFNNTAYYHAQKAHMESVPCGGWSLSYWRGMNGTVDLDLVYCEHVSPDSGEASEFTSEGIRVCGAFALSSFAV